VNLNLDIGTIVVAAIVGAASTFLTMWRTSIVLETRMAQISSTLDKFTAVVDRLAQTVDGMNHVHDNIEDLFRRVNKLEQQSAAHEARVDLLEKHDSRLR
jgi:outer membrane murein-binding lipoprotein Lpp